MSQQKTKCVECRRLHSEFKATLRQIRNDLLAINAIPLEQRERHYRRVRLYVNQYYRLLESREG